MVPEAVRTGRGKGARTGVVRMLAIFMGRNLWSGEKGAVVEQEDCGPADLAENTVKSALYACWTCVCSYIFYSKAGSFSIPRIFISRNGR